MKQILNWFIRLDNGNKVALIIALLGMAGGVFAYFDSSSKKDTPSEKEDSVVSTHTSHGKNSTHITNNPGTIYIGNPSHSTEKK